MKVWRGGSCAVNFNPLFNQVTLCIYKEKMKLCISCCLYWLDNRLACVVLTHGFICCVRFNLLPPLQTCRTYLGICWRVSLTVNQYLNRSVGLLKISWQPILHKKSQWFFLFFFFYFNSAKLLILKVIVSVEFIYWNVVLVCCDA